MIDFIRSADPMVLVVGVLLAVTAVFGFMAVLASGPDRGAGARGLWTTTGVLLALTLIVAILVVIF